MQKKLFMVVALSVIIPILSFAISGCKGKVTNTPEAQTTVEMSETTSQTGSMPMAEPQIIEPAQTVATETIPPTAAPQDISVKAASSVEKKEDRAKDIQMALKNAGVYTGAIDGKIGPKTKKAVEEFQAAKGLKVDGKVGPKTWAELEKYLAQ